jgi:hypothetical protein
MSLNYSTIKKDNKNTRRYVCFKIIEKIVVYNQGEPFKEYTRFYGDELYVIYENGKVTLTTNENDASIFFDSDNPNKVYLDLIDKLKNKTINGDGIQVIEYNEIHNISSEVLHYPNRHYPDLIQPISIYNGYSQAREKSYERRNIELRSEYYEKLVSYINIYGWELNNDDWYYINNASKEQLKILLDLNKGRKKFYRGRMFIR